MARPVASRCLHPKIIPIQPMGLCTKFGHPIEGHIHIRLGDQSLDSDLSGLRSIGRHQENGRDELTRSARIDCGTATSNAAAVDAYRRIAPFL